MDDTPHPSTLSEILDRTVQIYRGRFLMFLGLAAAPYAAVLVPVCVFLLLGLWLLKPGPELATSAVTPILIGLGALVVAPVWIVTTALSTGSLNHAAAHSYFGAGITIRGAWNEAWSQRGRYTGLYLLEILLIWAAPVFVWVLVVAAGAAIAAVARTRGMGTSAGVLLGVMAVLAVAGLTAYGFWMLLRLALAFPACVVERIGVGEALRRGPSLSQGTKGRIFLLYLLGWILSYVLTLAVTLPLTIVVAMIPGLRSPQHAQVMGVVTFVAAYGMGIAAQALTKPVYAIALVLFYFDQRIRYEGFDIEWMMMRAGLVVPAPAEPEPQPWLAPPNPAESAPATPGESS
jgi:hypothetical protein